MDTAVIIVYLLLVLGIGYYFRHSSSSSVEHFLAGRRMGVLPVGVSIMVTSFSAINYVAIPEEIASHGLYTVICFPVFFLAAWPISKIWMPYFHRMQTTSVYEFLELRYSRGVRQLASGLFLLWRFCWMAIVLYASGKILGVFSGYNPLVMTAVCGVVATMYTALGGMRAILWTDVLQFLVLLTGIVFGVAFGFRVNGTSPWRMLEITDHLRPYVPLDSAFFSFDPRIRITLWSGVIGTFVAFLSRYGADQVVMQRYFAAKDLKTAQRGIWLNAVISTVALSLLSLLGLAIYAYGVQKGTITMYGNNAPGTILKVFSTMVQAGPPGLWGLVTAGILAATMSSIDSGINSCSAALMTDFHKAATRMRLNGRWLTLALGGLVTILALLIPLKLNQTIFVIVNKLVNGLGSPLLAVIMLAMFDQKKRLTNARGMLWGTCIGLVASLVITFMGAPLALHYYAVANLIVTLAACVICSRVCRG